MENTVKIGEVEILERLEPLDENGKYFSPKFNVKIGEKEVCFESINEFVSKTLIGLNNWFFLRREKLLDCQDEKANQAAERLYYVFKTFEDGQIDREVFLKLMSEDLPKVIDYAPVENFGFKFKEVFGKAIKNSSHSNFHIFCRGFVRSRFEEPVCVPLYKNGSEFNELIGNYICIRLFKDFKHSVVKNLETFNEAYMRNFIEKSPRNNRLKLFYDKISGNYCGDFFREECLKEFKGIKEDLYDAFKEMQIKTFTDIKESLYSLDEKDVDQEKSNELGVKVYEIGDQPKKMLIHVTGMRKRETIKRDNLVELKERFLPQEGRAGKANDYISLSYIDNSDIKAFESPNDYISVIYGSDIPSDHLLTISNKDAYTEREETPEEAPYSSQVACYLSAKDLLEETDLFNEVAIIKADEVGGKGEKPNFPIAIFCNGDITEKDVDAAKYLNLPIVHSTTKKILANIYAASGVGFLNADAFEQEF